jgi:hypothetical protein
MLLDKMTRSIDAAMLDVNLGGNLVFPVAEALSERGIPFAFFAAMMGIQIVVVWKFFPETKRVALEDMEQRLKN